MASLLTTTVNGNLSVTGSISGGGVVTSTGGGAPYYGARAWASFRIGASNQPTSLASAILRGANVSSIVTVGFGAYYINFATAMPSNDFSTTGQGSAENPPSAINHYVANYNPIAGSFVAPTSTRIYFFIGNGFTSGNRRAGYEAYVTVHA